MRTDHNQMAQDLLRARCGLELSSRFQAKAGALDGTGKKVQLAVRLITGSLDTDTASPPSQNNISSIY